MNGKRGRTGIFVSYSHRDREWLDRLRVHLVPYLRGEKLSFWDDSQIRPGQSWREEIQRAMQTVRVAILLVSPDFLASDFIANVELPALLKEAKGSVTLLWVPVRAAAWETTPLRDFQAAWDPRRPLASLRPAQRDEALVHIAKSAGAAAGVSALATALRIADDFEPEVNAFVKGQPEPATFPVHGEFAEQNENRIALVRGGQRTELITADELSALDSESLKLIRAYERTMKDLFERWTELKPKRHAVDPDVRSEARAESDDVRRDLCGELNGLLSFLERLGKQLRDHYAHVRHICAQPAA